MLVYAEVEEVDTDVEDEGACGFRGLVVFPFDAFAGCELEWHGWSFLC